MSTPILAAVDFSSGSTAVVNRAVHLAKHTRAPLYVLHVSYVLPAPYFAELQPRIQATIDTAFAEYEALGRSQDISVTCDVREGGAYQEIIRYARRIGAGLIAVAPHGRNLLKDLMLGSVPSRLLHKSEIPVLVVRRAGGPYSKVVWLNDTSELAERAGSLARTLADGAAKVTAVAALERPEALALLPELGPLPAEVVELEARSRLELENAVKRAAAAIGWPQAEVVVDAGAPAELGLEVAEQRDADLIALGTHGLRSVGNILLGSTAEAVANRATCDVLTATPSVRHFRLP